MKTSGFKMRGYDYPGTSPVKGKKAKAKRAEAATKAEDAMVKMEEELGKEYKSTSILTKPGAPLKGSPAKEGEGFIDWSQIATDAVGSVVQAGVGAGVDKLTKGRKKPTRNNAHPATIGGATFGSGSKII
jgi:hypothetical protein